MVFTSDASEPELKAAIEARLLALAGRRVGVMIRTATETAGVIAGNPFPFAPGNRVTAIFLDGITGPSMLEGVTGRAPDEALALGEREIYVRYGSGMAATKLRIPAAAEGTARGRQPNQRPSRHRATRLRAAGRHRRH